MHDIVHFLGNKIELVGSECYNHPGQRHEANCVQCWVPVCLIGLILGPHKLHKEEELPETLENICI